MTRRLNPDAAGLAEAAALLRAGELVAFPTETVYGLGANALSVPAVRGIFTAKGRPLTDPLIIHLADVAQVETVASSMPALAKQLAEAFWPGPLTLVLPRQPHIPPEVTAGRETVAVRVPAHPLAHTLLKECGLPVAAPSANRFSRPSPTNAQHVLEDLAGDIAAVLDGGTVTIGLESTIVDVTQDLPTILRPGGLTLEALRLVAPEIEMHTRYLNVETPAAAPGQFLKHYAPNAALQLVDGEREAALNWMRARAAELLLEGKHVGVLAFEADAAELGEARLETVVLGADAHPESLAHNLFAALRTLDARGVYVILARLPAAHGLGWAIRDRLYRAAEGRVEKVE
jgi:L-threonylcarbamoyladenylate synthase